MVVPERSGERKRATEFHDYISFFSFFSWGLKANDHSYLTARETTKASRNTYFFIFSFLFGEVFSEKGWGSYFAFETSVVFGTTFQMLAWPTLSWRRRVQSTVLNYSNLQQESVKLWVLIYMLAGVAAQTYQSDGEIPLNEQWIRPRDRIGCLLLGELISRFLNSVWTPCWSCSHSRKKSNSLRLSCDGKYKLKHSLIINGEWIINCMCLTTAVTFESMTVFINNWDNPIKCFITPLHVPIHFNRK